MQNARTTYLTILLIVGLSDGDRFSVTPAKSIKHKINLNLTTTLTSTTRNPKIMYGFPTRDGEFGWQASLELLHPSFGFIGHWCGGVLINQVWVLSAAHCVHNDLFNLPLPALWTVILGEHNRKIESGFEQRIPVDKIIMHEKYRNFKNDLVLLKLSRPANISPNSKVKRISLPPAVYTEINSNDYLKPFATSNNNHDQHFYDRQENYLRKLIVNENVSNIAEMIAKVNQNELNKRQTDNKTNILKPLTNANKVVPTISPKTETKPKRNRRRNDKFLHRRPTNNDDYLIKRDNVASNSIDYIDCVATGWGKSTRNGELTDKLLKIDVPIQNIKRCEEVYSGYVSLHTSQHLCAGNLNGKGGTCVGDSGGGMQCKLKKSGPWILVGITSFGSGCAKEGYPDVFTNVAYYKSWIDNVIENN
ncbi:unnamed protein product [Diamesa serratosioi]